MLSFVYAVPDKTAESVFNLYDTSTSLFGTPDNVICDDGGEFGKIPEELSTLWCAFERLCKLKGGPKSSDGKVDAAKIFSDSNSDVL